MAAMNVVQNPLMRNGYRVISEILQEIGAFDPASEKFRANFARLAQTFPVLARTKDLEEQAAA
jgi:hypothetical protein